MTKRIRIGMSNPERGDLPGDITGVGDTVRFFHGKRLFRGMVISARDLVVTVETKSGRTYGIFRNDVHEIEAFRHS